MSGEEEVIAMDPRDVEGRVQGKRHPDCEDCEEEEREMEVVDANKGIHDASYAPLSATSFEELESAERAMKAGEQVMGLVDKFSNIVGRILVDKTVDQQSAINRVTQEFMQRVERAMHFEKDGQKESTAQTKSKANLAESDTEPAVEQGAREAYMELGFSEGEIPKSAEQETGFRVWKQKDGTYRWLAVYSNNFRDDDNPPEIISRKSHKTFVEMVDKSIVPFPELWLWHIPGTRVGQADMVDFTTEGFAVASGTFDPGREKVAQSLAKMTDQGVSHGMLPHLMKRNADDPSIIDFHVTTEVKLYH